MKLAALVTALAAVLAPSAHAQAAFEYRTLDGAGNTAPTPPGAAAARC